MTRALIRYFSVAFLTVTAIALVSQRGICQVRINEVVSSNRGSLVLAGGKTPDWIEIVNVSDEIVVLDGWFFSDDEENPQSWSFPEGVVMQPGEYCVVHASGESVSMSGGLIHAPFSIRMQGESLVLSRPDGVFADRAPAWELLPDVSLGRVPDGLGEWKVFENPTPGSANTSEAFEGILSPPLFSLPSGFHSDPIQLGMSAEEGAKILYTLDGSDPLPGRNSAEGYVFNYKDAYPRLPGNPFGPLLEARVRSHSYEGWLTLADRTAEVNFLPKINTWFETGPRVPPGPVRKAQVLRARAYRQGYIPSRIVSQSQWIANDIFTRYGLPVVHVITDPVHFFDYTEGIYVPGKIADDWRKANPNSTAARWQIPGNYTQRGKAWERPAQVELFESDGTLVFSRQVEAEIHGAASRDIYIKSLRVKMDPSDGGGERLRAEVFPGLKKKAKPSESAMDFDTLLLRNSGNDARGLFFRDAFIQHLVSHLPLETQAYRPAVQAINGESWGLINLRERIDAGYLFRHFDLEEAESVILELSGLVDHGMPGDGNHYQQLRNFAATQDMTLPANYEQIRQWMDVENHALYHAFQIYIDNGDWPGNNMKLWRKRTSGMVNGTPHGHDGRWRWLVYDTDFGMFPENTARNTLARIAGGTDWTTLLFRRLLLNPEYRNEFLHAISDLRNSSFAPHRVNRMIDAFVERLDPARDEHFHRWQEPGLTFNSARNQANGVKTFAAGRGAAMAQHAISRFGLSGESNLTLDVEPSTSGRLRVNRLTLENGMPGHEGGADVFPWNGIYFQGIPIRIIALPADGQRFAGWKELPNETSPELEISLEGDQTLTALFEPVPTPVTIHSWNFNTEREGFPPADSRVHGSELIAEPGTSSELLRSPATQEFTSPHLRVNNPLGSTLLWKLPTIGFTNLVLSYATRRSGQGAGTQVLSYTLDGSHWTEWITFAVEDAAPQRVQLDFSTVPGVSDNPDFAVRIRFAQGVGGLAGNNRFDDWLLAGNPLPGNNLAPHPVGALVAKEAVVGGDAIQVSLDDLFVDPNQDPLTYEWEVVPADAARVEILNENARIELFRTGETVVSFTASDGASSSPAIQLPILAFPSPAILRDEDFYWREWNPAQPAGTFPNHMLFLQGEGNNDSTMTTPLTRAYRIPLEDAAQPSDTLLPYAATSRTRITALGTGGISFVNTGRGRDLGGVLLSLDTRGIPAASLGWSAGTVSLGTRAYAIRLQARTSPEQAFTDVTIEGNPVEYVRSETAGHRASIGPIALPEALLGQPNLQLLWRYHQTGGNSGARDQLSLDDIWLSLPDHPRHYETWRMTHFPLDAERETESVSGSLAMSHGHTNLMRYALGASRDEDLSGRFPHVSQNEGETNFRFPYHPAKRDLIYRVRSSSDLQSWNDTVFDSTHPVDPAQPAGWIEIPFFPSSGNTIFYRLEIETR